MGHLLESNDVPVPNLYHRYVAHWHTKRRPGARSRTLFDLFFASLCAAIAGAKQILDATPLYKSWLGSVSMYIWLFDSSVLKGAFLLEVAVTIRAVRYNLPNFRQFDYKNL
ncbi:hypothetical protein BZG05_08110 [Salinivibrio kushneri]|nr:hypothetical protein BZG05_08110 [Salinivibrio kushneri]